MRISDQKPQSMKDEYNGSLTREKFLFYEIKTVASLWLRGYCKDDIAEMTII